MRFVPNKELPAAVAKVTGTKKLIYEQENRLDRSTNTLHWQVFPAVVQDKVSAKGKMVMRAIPSGVERVVDGDITVKIPIVGRKIEKLILGSVAQSYEHAAVITKQWLDSNRS